jgi:hypothetical protein
MQTHEIRHDIHKIRAAFGGCVTSSYKQRGLRRLREAQDMLGKNNDHAESMLREARYELQYAAELTEIRELRSA